VGYILPVSAPAREFTVSRDALTLDMVLSASINHPIIRSWLDRCEANHSESCHTCHASHRQSSQHIPIYAIDCNTRTVVPICPDDEYVTLSYVWGSQTSPAKVVWNDQSQKTADGGPRAILAGEMPRVVADAMVVTQNLGKRYLWVDRYCIDRGNHGLKQRQIRSMDLIYKGAYVTIAACAGSDSSFVLPGVGDGERNSHASRCRRRRTRTSHWPLASLAGRYP